MNKQYTLREWQLSDKGSLAENANNIHIWNNVRDSFPHPYTEKDAEEYLQMVSEQEMPTTNFAIVVDSKAVGGIGIMLKSDVERATAEIGYWLGEAYWNKGIMTKVVKEITYYAFAHFPIKKLYASVFETNVGSARVLYKAGFTKEAVLKKAIIKNDVIMDLHYYSIETELNFRISLKISIFALTQPPLRKAMQNGVLKS